MKKQKEKEKKSLHKTLKAAIRKNSLKDGYYDGRFVTKTVPNKKRKNNKQECKKRVFNIED